MPVIKHLVVGAGHMGKYHGGILKGFGDSVEYADLEFNPDTYDLDRIDSVLICTPPETHLELYNRIISKADHHNKKTWKPIFIEKPFVTDTAQKLFYVHPKTMIACNWRWCDCIIPVGKLLCMYPFSGPYSWMDQIHFLDLYWARYGKPALASVVYSDLGSGLAIRNGPEFTTAIINHDNPQSWFGTSGSINRIHFHEYCSMFLRQMQAWRDLCLGKIESPNPMGMAYERTSYLIEIASAGKSTNAKPVERGNPGDNDSR